MKKDGDFGEGGLVMRTSHLSVLFEAKCFAKDEPGEDRVVITGNCLPGSFYYKVPSKENEHVKVGFCSLGSFWLNFKGFVPGVGWSCQGIVSAQPLLKQPLDCRTQASSYDVCYRLVGDDSAENKE